MAYGTCKIRGTPLTSFLTSSPSNPVLQHTRTDPDSSLYTGSSHSGSWVLLIMGSAERPSWPRYLQQHPPLPCPPSRSPFPHSTYHYLKLFISVCPWLFSISSHYNVSSMRTASRTDTFSAVTSAPTLNGFYKSEELKVSSERETIKTGWNMHIFSTSSSSKKHHWDIFIGLRYNNINYPLQVYAA